MKRDELSRKIFNNAVELGKYGSVDNTELGEVCFLLSEIGQNTACLTDEFMLPLHEEIKKHLENYQKNATIVKKEETFTRIVEYLEWYDEGE